MRPEQATAVRPRAARWAPWLYVLTAALDLAAFLKIAGADPLSSVGQTQSIYEPVLLVISSTLLFARLGGKIPWKLILSGPLASIAVYAAFAGLSASWSLDPVLTIGKSLELGLSLVNAVLLVAAVHRDGLSDRLYLFCALAVLGTIAAFLVVNQVMYGSPLRLTSDIYDQRERLWLAYTHPLTVADLASLGILCALLAHTRRWIKSVLVVLLALVVYLTQSRGATVGVLLAVLAFAFSRTHTGAAPRWRFAFLLALALFVVGAVIAMLVSDTDYLADIPPEVMTLNGRLDLWLASLDFAFADPLRTFFGYGYYASRFVLLDSFDWGGHTHQVLLEVLLTTGIAGLSIFGYFLVRMLRLAVVDAGLLTIAAYVIAVGFDDPILFQPGVPMMVVMWSMAHVLERRRVATPQPGVGREAVHGPGWISAPVWRAEKARPAAVRPRWGAGRASPHRP